MNATFKQTATLSQRLKLSRTMKQSLELLQYSTEELHDFLLEQLEEIPFLKVNFYEGPSFRSHASYHTIEHMPEAATGRQLLHNMIREQLLNEDVHADVVKAIHWLIDDLDEDGLLRSNVEEYAMLIGTSVSVVTEAIRFIQRCEPAGIGASTLEESLLIQARRLQLSPAVIELLSNHFEQLCLRKWREIAIDTGFTAKEIQEAVDQIGQLQINPLHHILSQNAQYVRPDAELTVENHEVNIRFYKHAFPDIGIDVEYIKALPLHEQPVKQFVVERKERIQSIRAQLLERRTTIKIIIEKIAERQHGFFKEGITSMVPMTMTELAKQLELHESTISRAIRGKYIHTPFGTMPLRQFFIQSATSNEMIKVSPNLVKETIKGLIAQEDKKKPLSDQKIAELLKTDGIPLSRRVIAKYREQMKIPASSYRKRLN